MFDGNFLGSKFVLIFRGDEPIAYLCEDYAATLEKLRGELDIPADEFRETFGHLSNENEWQHNDRGPFSCQDEYGDGCFIQIIRIDKEE